MSVQVRLRDFTMAYVFADIDDENDFDDVDEGMCHAYCNKFVDLCVFSKISDYLSQIILLG